MSAMREGECAAGGLWEMRQRETCSLPRWAHTCSLNSPVVYLRVMAVLPTPPCPISTILGGGAAGFVQREKRRETWSAWDGGGKKPCSLQRQQGPHCAAAEVEPCTGTIKLT